MQTDLFPQTTPESLTQEMVESLSTNLQTNEGSYTRDLLATVGLALFGAYKTLNKMLAISFVNETSGEYLEARCAEYGITRKPGAPASVTLEFTGKNGTIIPAGTTVSTEGGILFSVEEAKRISNDVVEVPAVSQNAGSEYNVPANTLVTLVTPVSGVQQVTNPAAAEGGADEETDESLFSRLDQYRKNRATSGNIADYLAWAMETPGVGAARVFPIWNGPGTVKVILVGDDKKPVDAAIVQSCLEHIETVRPIGAQVTVESAGAFTVDVAASVQLAEGAVLETVKTEFFKKLEEYFQELALQKDMVPYNRVAFLLLSIPGVDNFTALTINKTKDNLIIPNGSVPVLGEGVMV
ncbi:MAG: baseplate J/gp47 family protein [Clostridiales bacterium]|jgi:uncharacterized phage protein gp47/JayE|nr:baseplate J/gp47 family protein [Clostridiales bacterium]